MSSESRVSAFRRKLFHWKSCSRPPERRRLVQPNHTVPEDTPVKQHPSYGFAGNCVRTTKYTPLTFLPKNLFEQFHRFANLYFLFIVFLNWMPAVSAFGKEVSMIPVLFVLAVTAIKDAFEDRRRYLSDKRVNNSTCRVFCKFSGRYVKRLWSDVRVGDILHLSCNETIPADILLLRSSDEHGMCYVQTSNLDGESNLKQRQIAKGYLAMQNVFHPMKFIDIIECDPPNNKMYRFHGSIVSPSGSRVAVTKENLLLRDCVIKNTDFVEGIAVYAGHETKAMLNNGGPRHKRSRVEKLMNRDIVFCIIILIVLCVTGAVGTGLWLGSWDFFRLIPFLFSTSSSEESPSWEGFLVFWTFVIILQVMIPLSLYVTLELIKLGQVFHIHEDEGLYDHDTNKRVECRALNIPEELGQVEYIFSDKTGTLTENKMIFRRCTIGGNDYPHLPCPEESSTDEGTSNDTKSEPSFVVDPKLQSLVSDMEFNMKDNCRSVENRRIQDFFLLLAVCNTVVVSKVPHKDQMNSSGLYLDSFASNVSSASSSPCIPQYHHHRLLASDSPLRPRILALPSTAFTPSPAPKELRPFYEAESPDEIALVETAFQYGCRLVRRTPDTVVLAFPGEGLLEFRLLHVLPFDSVRKRMSVILQHPFTNRKVLFCKGADSSILPNLAHTYDPEMQLLISRTQNHINDYGRKGLRILCMAKRMLSQEEYEMWALLHKEAEMALDDKEQRLYESACRIEIEFELLGATGIEDRLQDGVPETIASLRSAGIVIWVLTGDKQETAINIAYSCQLFTMEMEIITINARSKDAAEETIKFYLDQMEKDHTLQEDEPAWMRPTRLLFRVHSSNNRLSRQRSQMRSRRALVVDGHTLAYLLDKDLDRPFLRLARSCCSVLCCRATPLQKSSVVKLVKDRMKVLTLAVGDGANDVSMIQTADVGVGISGQEGMQAVMASDFALARFRYLERLLLIHGHWCYDRLARIILYFFYKNASFIFVIFWYQFFCGFSGSVPMDQLYLMLFNVLFTSLPPLIIGIYDQNLPDYLLQSHPNLYSQPRKSQIYTKYSFWINILDALYQSAVIYFFPHLTYQDTDVGIWEFGTTIYTLCIVVQLVHVSIETCSWTILHVLSIIFSLGVFFGFAVVYNMLSVGSQSLVNPYWVIQYQVNTWTFWLVILVSTVLACIPRFAFRALQNTIAPSEIIQTLVDHKESRKLPEQAVMSVSFLSRDSSVLIEPLPSISASVHA